MSPDLNSLPASRPSPTQPTSSLAERPRRISFHDTDSLRTSPLSPRAPLLASSQAAASINTGLQHSLTNASPARSGMERRRSSLLNNLPLSDSQQRDGSINHSPRAARRSFLSHETPQERQLSLGELHQELENEQEAQVNRLLYMIRQQQDQLAALSREHSQDAAPASPTEHTASPRVTPSVQSTGQFRPHSLSRQSSSRLSTVGTNSRGASPALRPVSASLGPLTEDFLLGGTRDESAFYQAETQMLTRENQMLKQRIRELERQIADSAGPSSQQQQPQHQQIARQGAVVQGAKE